MSYKFKKVYLGIALCLFLLTFVSANPLIKNDYTCYPIIEKDTSNLIHSFYQNNRIVGVIDYSVCEVREPTFLDQILNYGIAKKDLRGNC
jgi:hypothetical protein